MAKHVLSNNIATGVKQPYTQRTHIHYNEMIDELAVNLVKSLNGDVNTSNFYVLYGCVNSASPNANVSAGAIYYNGEIYLCDAFVDGAISGAIVGTITTTYAIGDPINFSNNSDYNVHQIKKIVWSDATSGTGSVNFLDLVQLGGWTSISSGLTFKYVDDGGTTRTIVASPSIVTFKYRIRQNVGELIYDINSIDTSTSNSGTGFRKIIIEGLPFTPLSTPHEISVIGDNGGGGTRDFRDVFWAKITTNVLTVTSAIEAATTWAATGTRIKGQITFEI